MDLKVTALFIFLFQEDLPSLIGKGGPNGGSATSEMWTQTVIANYHPILAGETYSVTQEASHGALPTGFSATFERWTKR